MNSDISDIDANSKMSKIGVFFQNYDPSANPSTEDDFILPKGKRARQEPPSPTTTEPTPTKKQI